eukprot:CAMPEP_0168208370 /NCGR_PEP_ID=MMETSP0140_2-20121125/2032_1 /TAXON_ID=44445 /ORGANISM="Pseudo-nitzschia australis, Strain 10249 10 AB" /LENGTH=670 /DNA_ID=CAMNT_0008134763 /DNA_START=360 /DNA_END=2374 /DNA_ORIENTATION=-
MSEETSTVTDTTSNCIPRTVSLIIKDNDPEMAAVKDYLKADLAKVGIELEVIEADSETYIERERDGNFNMLFTRTWGAPYDPHSYLESWETASHVEYSVLGGLEPPLTRDFLLEKIEEVQEELDVAKIQEKYTEILTDIHQQAIFVPLWGTRIPYVVSRRLAGFTPSDQTYSYPLTSVRVLEGSKKVTVNPGAGGSLFTKLGPTNPHQYFPNQLFAEVDWIFQKTILSSKFPSYRAESVFTRTQTNWCSLCTNSDDNCLTRSIAKPLTLKINIAAILGLRGPLEFGQDGEISPGLATSWKTVNSDSGGQIVTFDLRKGVKFHDGSDFNCTVAKLNFDHILHEIVVKRHSWYGTPQRLTSWSCNEQEQFVLETDKPFYPLLQELTYIRPLVFASASAFSNGIDSDPSKENSCNAGDFGSKWDHLEDTVTCAGLSAPIGTGPFKYSSTTTNEDGTIDDKVIFQGHTEYWGGAPDIEELHVQHYESNEAVQDALLDGTLDMALGIGPLTPLQAQQLKFYHSDKVDVRHSDVLQNAIMVMNTNKAPTDDIDLRKAIIHAIDKSTFIATEFAGLERPVDQVLPESAPFCNVDLSPKWTYDPEKAKFLNCPTVTTTNTTTMMSSDVSAKLSSGAVAGIAIAAVVGVSLILFVLNLVRREQEGKPMFAPKKGMEEVA